MKWTREKGDWQCGVGQVVISGRVGLGEGVEMNYPASVWRLCLYLVEAQALFRLCVERVPQQLQPRSTHRRRRAWASTR